MEKRKIWRPLSSNAYGANAVFIPDWGKDVAIEFILLMTQNYPVYKTHPVLDIYHGYVTGPERFESNHEFRVLGWDLDSDFKRWSFLYLPDEREDVRTTAVFIPARNGNMRLFLKMENPSMKQREWEFHLYVSPCRGVSLPKYRLSTLVQKNLVFTLDGVRMWISSENMAFKEASVVRSDFWINFPFNANETSRDPYNPRDRKKKRALIKFSPVIIDARESSVAIVDFLTERVSAADFRSSTGNFPEKKQKDLSYKHLWWETLHNQQYTRSFLRDSMTNHIISGREWGSFYIWDAGMTAIGAIEEDEKIAGDIIAEMPDPARMGKKVLNYGSFIPTAVFALWELYQKKGDTRVLKRHYDLMRRLVFAMYFYPMREGDIRHDGMVRPVRNRTGADDYPTLVYADGWPFAWDYRETLPLNPSRKVIQILSVGMTCMAVRMLKILRLAAYVLGKKEDIATYDNMIDRSEKSMNEQYWDDTKGRFLNRLESVEGLLDIEGVYEYLPLFSGSVDTRRRNILMRKLTVPGKYWTPHGITVVARDDQNYREDGYWNGGIWIPTQWFFWKTFYNIGRMDLAEKISNSAIKLWDDNHKKTLCCWEEFRVRGGRPAGNSRFSGLSTPLMALWKGRRGKGRVQAGQEMIVRSGYDSEKEEISISAETPFYTGSAGLSFVAGRPGTEYHIEIEGEESRKILTDCHGYAGFSVNVQKGGKKSIRICSERA